MKRTVAVLVAILLVSCVKQTELEYEFPDEKGFVDNSVSLFMERRCGSMDCHGQVGRPLRIYSQRGLRLDAKGGRNGETTAEERKANYISVIGLEPEELTIARRSKGNYVDFMLFKKPLGEEGLGVKHKGGPVLAPSKTDPGWECLRSWVFDTADKAECEKAASALDPPSP